MAHSGAPGANLNNNPVVRKLEGKVQHVEKRLAETEKREAEANDKLKALEAKLTVLMRMVKELQQGSTTPHFAPLPSMALPTSMVVGDEAPANGTPAVGGMSIEKIDAMLSNIGIRVVQVDHDFLEMEPLNAWGSENLRQLGNYVQLKAVEKFLRQKENLA